MNLFITLLFVLNVACYNAKSIENSTAYLPIENEIDEEPNQVNKVKDEGAIINDHKNHVQNYMELGSSPIQMIVEQMRQLIDAIPDTIANFFVNLLSPFIEEDLIRERVVHFIHSLIELIEKEFPKPLSQFLYNIGDWVDMGTLVG